MKSLILKIKMLFSTLTTWFANVIKANDEIVKVVAPVGVNICNFIKEYNGSNLVVALEEWAALLGGTWGKVAVKLDIFQKMIIYKILREEKLILIIKNFVLKVLGKIFIESPVFDLKGAFEDSSSTTPIIFVLSPGADPISYLLALAKEK